MDSNQSAAPQSRNTHYQSIETTPDELLNTKRQTELLTIICRELTRPPNKTEFICYAILQLIALVIGVLFGVFSILAYKDAQTANKQSLAANQIALLSLCLSSNSVDISVPLIYIPYYTKINSYFRVLRVVLVLSSHSWLRPPLHQLQQPPLARRHRRILAGLARG